MRGIPYPTFEGDADSEDADEFYDAFYERIGRADNRRGDEALVGLAKVAITHGLEVIYYEEAGDIVFDIVKTGTPARSEELPRKGDLRRAKLPHFGEDRAVAAFYNATGMADYDQPYDLLKAADKLLEKFGLEVICYEGSSDLDFEIARHIPAGASGLGRPRGPREVSLDDVLEKAGLDPALAAVIDPPAYVEPQSKDEIRRQRKHAAELLKRFVPQAEPAVVGVEALTLEEVMSLLTDKSVTGEERKALHARLDQIVLES